MLDVNVTGPVLSTTIGSVHVTTAVGKPGSVHVSMSSGAAWTNGGSLSAMCRSLMLLK